MQIFDVATSKVSLQAYVNEEDSCGKRLVIAQKTIDGRSVRYIDYRQITRFEKLLRTFCLGPAIFKSIIHESIAHGVLSTLSIDEKERLLGKVMRYNTAHQSLRSSFFKISGRTFFNWLLESHVQRAKGAHEMLTQDAALVESLKLSQQSRALLLLAAPNIQASRLLHVAAESGFANIVQKVLAAWSCDPNEQDEQGFTPLHLACKNGQFPIVQMLTDYSYVKLNQKSQSGLTPLHLAVINGHAAVARHLMEYEETDVNAQDSEGWTPLHYAAELGKKDMVELLLMHRKINVNAESVELFNPLQAASRSGHTAIVETLCRHTDARPNRHDNGGWTALHYAANDGHEETMEMLLRVGAFVNAQDDEGWTPLHVAASEGHVGAVGVLLRAAKVSPFLTDYSNRHSPHTMVLDKLQETKEPNLQERFRIISDMLSPYSGIASLRRVSLPSRQKQDSDVHSAPS